MAIDVRKDREKDIEEITKLILEKIAKMSDEKRDALAKKLEKEKHSEIDTHENL